MRARRLLSITLLLAASAAATGAAIVWHSLGTTSVRATAPDAAAAQRAEIRLASARGSFASIKLEIDGGTVMLERLVVTFAHGSTQSVELKKTFDAGAMTAEIPLTGSDHVIRKVDFWYRAPKFANVRLYAR